MTLIDDSAERATSTDVEGWFDALPPLGARTLRSLGELLAGTATASCTAEDTEKFTARGLGVAHLGGVVDEERSLTSVGAITTAMALGELIDRHAAAVGPAAGAQPPAYTQTKVGNRIYRHPAYLRAAFPTGTLLADAPCVVEMDIRSPRSASSRPSRHR